MFRLTFNNEAVQLTPRLPAIAEGYDARGLANLGTELVTMSNYWRGMSPREQLLVSEFGPSPLALGILVRLTQQLSSNAGATSRR